MFRITIKEIAQMSGVSPTAVSFVLNNRKGVSEKTRQKILEVIQSVNFIPNRSSQRLSFKKSFNLCLVMNPKSSPFTDFFYFDVTRGIMEESNRHDYNLVLSLLKYANNEAQIPDSVNNQDADGIIFLQDTPDAVLSRVESLGVPFVLVDAQVDQEKYTTINPDSERSAYAAVEYLLKMGHRKIGFIGSSYLPRYYIQTIAGYKKALQSRGLSVNHQWLFSNAHDEQSAREGMKKILRAPSIPTAIFCTGDIYAVSAIHLVQQKGFKVPGDISFIGMDD
ncbi:MAG: LacI family transcriptional regulator, partial [Treponema sp.]|nr:LacI family transcriptional regulator [Treponema sp.]